MKQNKLFTILNRVMLVILFMVITTLGWLVFNEKSTNQNSLLKKVQLIGTYEIDGVKKPLISEDLQLNDYNQVRIEGVFNEEISKNQQLIFRLDNLSMKMYINGILFYQYDNDQPFSISSGNVWESIVSPGITSDDQIVIELENYYRNHVYITYRQFIDHLYVGYESELIERQVQANLFNLFVSFMIISLGFISIFLGGIMKKMRRPAMRYVYFGGLCIFSGLWFSIDFSVQSYLIPYPIFNNSLDSIASLFSMYFLIMYIAPFMKTKLQYVLYSISGLFLAVIFTATITQYVGVRDYYHYLPWVQWAGVFLVPLIVGCILYELCKIQNQELKRLMYPMIVLAIGIFLDCIGNIFKINPFLFWFKISYIIFIFIQMYNLTENIRNAVMESARVTLLEELAYQDGLTKTNNRTAYLKRVEQVKEKKERIQLYIFDINNLKFVNDTMGHEAGDRFIQRAVMVLLSLFDAHDVYRIGGDEFVVITKKQEDLYAMIEHALEENNQCYHDEPMLSIAYGQVIYDGHTMTYEEAFDQADHEMFMHKNQIKKAMKQAAKNARTL